MRCIQSLFILLFIVTVGCGKGNSNDNAADTSQTTTTTTTTTIGLPASFAKGADVSWLTQMEASGYKFYNSAGTRQDLLQILKDKGINSIRLRVWVNPTDGWSNKADVLAKALRAKVLGMR